MKKVFIPLLLLSISSSSHADFFGNCFISKDKTFSIAQQLRQKSADMGWKIGKFKSISVAGVIKGKKTLYPDSKMEICLKEVDDELKFIMKSGARDSGSPEWHVMGSK